MGLGKTLSTIAHVLKQYQDNEEQDDSDSDSDVEKDNGWKSKGRKELKPGGKSVMNLKIARKNVYFNRLLNRDTRHMSCIIAETVGI